MYIFAVAFTQLTGGMSMGKLYFATIPRSMLTLLIHGCAVTEISYGMYALLEDNIGLVLSMTVYWEGRGEALPGSRHEGRPRCVAAIRGRVLE